MILMKSIIKQTLEGRKCVVIYRSNNKKQIERLGKYLQT